MTEPTTNFSAEPAACRACKPPLVVVFPVCHSDIGLALRHAEWLNKSGCKHETTAIVAQDDSLMDPHLGRFVARLSGVFTNVQRFRYPMPPKKGWPYAPNHAWQSVARHMATQRNPWLWLEADAVVLTPRWLDVLQTRYHQCGRRYMGPRVQGMGHTNGCAIYPADAATRLSSAMSATDVAWDFAAKEQMTPTDAHDASDLMQHIWSLVDGKPHPSIGNDPIRRITAQQANAWIAKDAVLVHRIKTTALTDLLVAGWRP